MPIKYNIFGIDIDVLDRKAAVSIIYSWLLQSDRNCRYVVTPNVDHVVMLDSHQAFFDAYVSASMVLADGKPIVGVSRLIGRALPETVPGSDLVPALFDHFSEKNSEISVFLLGAGPGVAERAKTTILNKWKNIKIVGVYSPKFHFELDEIECSSICKRVSDSGADLLIIGLGAPKQELWISKYKSKLDVKVSLCVGATIDFIAGEKKRAPVWVQRLGLEWLHRVLSEPKRLTRRYARDAIVFPRLVLREILKNSNS